MNNSKKNHSFNRTKFPQSAFCANAPRNKVIAYI